jgi:predicted nucleic acid-binding protein
VEYFADGPNAEFFTPALEATESLLVPTMAIYEVFKKVLAERGEGDAIQAVALMQQGLVRELTTHLALESARLSSSLGLPMADSVMLATAVTHSATLWTQDAHFRSVPGVRYVDKH